MRLIDDSDEAIRAACIEMARSYGFGSDYDPNTDLAMFKNFVERLAIERTPPAPTGPTVDVRIAVAVHPGGYFAYGDSMSSDDESEREALSRYGDYVSSQSMHWLTVTLPVTQVETVKAMVEEE